MPVVGKILVIWGALLPLIAFPAMQGYSHQLGLAGSLGQMRTVILDVEVTFTAIVVLGLLMIGFGLTAWTLPEPPDRETTANFDDFD